MRTSDNFVLSTVLACLLLFARLSFAQTQRPSNASVCDFYAQAKYGANTSDTQQNLIRHIVSLAFEGGSLLKNLPSGLTGILRPGIQNGVDVDLFGWFNGSKATTNVNNAPIGINWMDQGGTAPLAAYLAGDTSTLVLANTSNQYHLFGNFFVAFSHIFGCTLPFPPLANTSGPVSLAYAHKFMNLDFNQLGYFINQLTNAAIYFGFSTQDASTIGTYLNSQYNVRCAPAVVVNKSPQLLSLCQNPTCPLAAPVSDCAAYQDLQPNGVGQSNLTTATVVSTAVVTTGFGTPTGSASTASKSSSHLSAGGIAGIAIGGIVVLLLAFALLLFSMRRKRYTPEPHSGTPHIDPSSPYSGKDPNMSYLSAGFPGSDSATHAQAGRTVSGGSPDFSANQNYQPPPVQQHFQQSQPPPFQQHFQQPQPPYQYEPYQEPVEMGQGAPTAEMGSRR